MTEKEVTRVAVATPGTYRSPEPARFEVVGFSDVCGEYRLGEVTGHSQGAAIIKAVHRWGGRVVRLDRVGA